MIVEDQLRAEIIGALKSQGFGINGATISVEKEKEALRQLHSFKRDEQMKVHINFLNKQAQIVKKYAVSSEDIDPENIKLRLIEVKPDTLESTLFLWWNLAWWSLPYEKPIGRQMRFLLWDDYYNAPFGLIGLQSQPIHSKVRDSFLGLNNGNREFWINQSMYAQRVGALPPYNSLLGGKMVALTLTSNELRDLYIKKYKNRKTLLENRILPNHLLFISTTSAYGKSSMYDRITYQNEKVGQFIGYTSGAGTFQLSEGLYKKCLELLESRGINIKRGYGTGPSRKLNLIAHALRLLKISGYQYHNVQRGYYIFPHIKNLSDVIHKNKEPDYFHRSFVKLTSYWKERWAIPRDKRNENKEFFSVEGFIDNFIQNIKNIR